MQRSNDRLRIRNSIKELLARVSSRASLRFASSGFPAVDGAKGHAQTLGKLLLREGELGAEGAKGRVEIGFVCHACYVGGTTGNRSVN